MRVNENKNGSIVRDVDAWFVVRYIRNNCAFQIVAKRNNRTEQNWPVACTPLSRYID